MSDLRNSFSIVKECRLELQDHFNQSGERTSRGWGKEKVEPLGKRPNLAPPDLLTLCAKKAANKQTNLLQVFVEQTTLKMVKGVKMWSSAAALEKIRSNQFSLLPSTENKVSHPLPSISALDSLWKKRMEKNIVLVHLEHTKSTAP